MQTKALLLASGIPRVPSTDAASSAVLQRDQKMSKTVSFGFAPPTSLFGRFMATLDRLLMVSAEIAIRNGEPPYFGL
jgi:hypothetical protein